MNDPETGGDLSGDRPRVQRHDLFDGHEHGRSTVGSADEIDPAHVGVAGRGQELEGGVGILGAPTGPIALRGLAAYVLDLASRERVKGDRPDAFLAKELRIRLDPPRGDAVHSAASMHQDDEWKWARSFRLEHRGR